MAVVRLDLMDRAALTRDGEPVRLEPRFMAVLIRLALDLGRSVRADDLSSQILAADAGPAVGYGAKDEHRRRRIHVYKCISAIRAALDPANSGESSALLVSDSGANSGYRLELAPDDVDLLRFERLITASRSAPPLRAITQLREASSLWRGRPLIDVEHHAWARERIGRLVAAHAEGRRRLFDLYVAVEQFGAAAELGAALVAEHPDDAELRRRYADLARQGGPHGINLRYETGYSRAVIVVRTGDLLDQHDAHLVIGFCDTFETNTADDILVSRASLQGQLLDRLYGGDHHALDRELRKALRHTPRKIESRAVKHAGKLSRFALGTVAVLNQAGRRIFAVAYSKIDNDGRYTRSSPARMRLSLDRLWRSVHAHGQHRPVALGVLGAGLARIDELDRVDLIQLTVRSYLKHQSHARIADELRIIIHPKDAVAVEPDRIDEAIVAAIAESHLAVPPRIQDARDFDPDHDRDRAQTRS